MTERQRKSEREAEGPKKRHRLKFSLPIPAIVPFTLFPFNSNEDERLKKFRRKSIIV